MCFLMNDVHQWLASIGFGQYAVAFEENAIDWELLPKLNQEILKDIGVKAAGHRIRILEAIEKLDAAAPIDPSPTPARTNSDAERRQLTVMFCDLVGSTALSTQMDPEDLRDVITSFQDECREAIKRYDGFIARYMGDGMLVYFGYPQAHEDDAERGVRAALAILSAVPGLHDDVGARYGANVAVRIGVATGPVVVGDIVGEGASEEAAVVGETPNLAARLQGVAKANQVVIGPGTQRLIGSSFQLEDIGLHELRGISDPVRAWCVAGVREAPSLEAHSSSPRTLVGRREELGLLSRSWESAREGHGQVVLLQGEAGIGKSRLVDALRDVASSFPHTWISLLSSPYHTTSPLYPVAEQLKRALGWSEEDLAPRRLEKLEQTLAAQTTFPVNEIVPLFAALLSLSLPPERYAVRDVSPKERHESTLDALSGWLLELTEAKPVILIWEDIHWADPTTVELLGSMLEEVPTTRMLMVVTYRLEFAPTWPVRTHVTPMTLSRLERAEVDAMATGLSGGKPLPPAVLSSIAMKADGVPLYVEELTRTILGSTALIEEADHFTLRGPFADVEIPETLQDSLMARLDRAPAAREVAQLGAVLGREFTYEMMRRLAPLEESRLQECLEQLVQGELLYQRGRGQRSRFHFKHALIRDAAYQSLLRRKRQEYHAKVAELFEGDFVDATGSQPELLAHHYSLSGERSDRAVGYWEQAADLALARGANVEAVSHLHAALEGLKVLPESAERNRRELELQTKIGPAIIATRGYADPQVGRCYRRAQALCETLGDTTNLVFALRGQVLTQQLAGDIAKAYSISKQMAEVISHQGSTALKVGAYHSLAQSSLHLGYPKEAIEHAETGIGLFDPKEPPVIQHWPGTQPGPSCYVWGGQARWLMGEPDTALGLIDVALNMVNAPGQELVRVATLATGSLVPAWGGPREGEKSIESGSRPFTRTWDRIRSGAK